MRERGEREREREREREKGNNTRERHRGSTRKYPHAFNKNEIIWHHCLPINWQS